MSKYDVTIIVPGIRTSAWKRLYESAFLSCENKTFEMIFVGPNPPDEELLTNQNLRFIQDYGSPNRCQQIAASEAQGKYLTWAADDGVLIPETLSKTIDFLEQLPIENAACMKFLESENPSPDMRGDLYYRVNHSTWTRAPYISDDQLIMNTGLVRTEIFREIGGFDTESFETTAMAHSDLAVRLTHFGVKIHLINMIFIHVGFTPGDSGDHGPVFAAHHDSDIPRFVSTYTSPDSLNRCKIDFENYKRVPSRWKRRFGE
jgi:GT2 family glycosyltransferase